jgi:hypothetical protein
MKPVRNWNEIEKRHRAFWQWDPVDRPLIQVIHDAYIDTELVAAAMGEGELLPHQIDPRPILGEYDKVAAAREQIGDDTIGVAEPLLGIPWLEAICGCRVMVADGKSLWPESPGTEVTSIAFDEQNPWFQVLLDVIETVVDYADGRYAVGLSHLRGPTDVLAALLGTTGLFAGFYDAPERIASLADQVATVWLNVAWAEAEIVPRYRGGYGVRQFGLWAPDLAPWLQDDTSSMMSVDHYRQLFLQPMERISTFPYGVLHLHIPSLHLAEMFAEVPNVRAINLYFDSPTVSLADAMPVLQRLQARRMPLILAKDVYEGFALEEYREILDGLSPRGLSVHLKATSIAQGRAVMDTVRAMAEP